jgi:hypothetical protein
MSQNTSTAVMQRRVAGTNGLDFYPTPPWATRALMEHVILPQLGIVGRLDVKRMTCWEPAAGHGDMAHPLAEYFDRVLATDIHDHGGGRLIHQQHDFLMPYLPGNGMLALEGVDWIITNPPFRLAEQFIERARRVPGWRGTAMLVRSAFLEGVGRYGRLYALNPPTVVAQFTERVVMHHGKLSPTGSTATAYCWLVWMANASPKPPVWIPPCRKKLERPDDYTGAPMQEAAE